MTAVGGLRRLGLVLLPPLVACAPEGPEPYEAVADVRGLMLSVIEPAAEVYWDAVGTIIDTVGTTELAPRTEEEWAAVRNAAVVMAESGNLLMMGDRSLDDGAWMAMSRAMLDVGRRAMAAAEARDPDAVFEVGGEVYEVCTNCHATYALETLRPSDARSGDGS